MQIQTERADGLGVRSDGHAMVTVIIVSFVLTLLTTIIVARTLRDQSSVLGQRHRERALHDAEAGIDVTLYELSQDDTYWTGDYLPTSFASDAAEEAWARTTAAQKSVTVTPSGEWAVVKPRRADGQTTNVIYTVGYEPSRSNPERTRVLRVEYDFAPFAIKTVSVLTTGDAKISGNPSLTGVAGSLHANGDVLVTGNPSFSGFAAASGTFTETGTPTYGDPVQTGGGKPERHMPALNVRDFYDYSQYDLCPDGTVREGPALTSALTPSATPCEGTILDTATSNSYRGWKMSGSGGVDGAKWDYNGNDIYDGVYYVYQGSAKATGSPGSASNPWNVTIIAEPTIVGCPSAGGDITFSGSPILHYHSTAQPALLIAGRDLDISGTSQSVPGYEGVLVAGEQLKINGDPDIYGAFLAYDICDTSGSAVHGEDSVTITGNATIDYNGDFVLPINTEIRITNWLEL